MSVSRQLPDYPILLSGVAAPVVKGLREMGLPVTELHDDLAQLSGYQSSSWNLLLVGSQKAFNVRDRQLLSHCRIPLIDLAEFTSKQAQARTRDEMHQKSSHGIEQFNAAFVIRLKDRLQQTGGVWIRLSDYPYPFQGVICYGESNLGRDFLEYTNVMSPLPVTLDHLHLNAEAGWLNRANEESARKLRVELVSSYRQGLPVSLTSIESQNQLKTLFENINLDRKQMPLVWVTSLTTFFRWWNLRRELSVSINRRNTSWETIISGQFEGFHPGLQIWKGRHSATVALSRGVNEIRDELLALAMNQERHPGGFTAHWAGSKSSILPLGWNRSAASAAS